jgi:hypothetical protein
MKSPSWSPLALTKSPEINNENKLKKPFFFFLFLIKLQKAKMQIPTSVFKQIHPALIVRPVPVTP